MPRLFVVPFCITAASFGGWTEPASLLQVSHRLGSGYMGNILVAPPVEVTQEKCGFEQDCPLDFDLRKMDVQAQETPLEMAHDKARSACEAGADIIQHGGWCYDNSTASWAPSEPKSDVEYRVPLNHIGASPVLVKVITDALRKHDGSSYSVSDLGAGVGQMGHALRAKLPQLEYFGYDGAGNVEEFTDNYVHFADLTMPLDLPVTDYVMSFEVGEHIPHENEFQVIKNLHVHNCKGIIMSWAVLGQGGHGHVNCHSNKYLVDIFTKLGYTYNASLAERLREYHPSHFWFHDSAMAFDRVERNPACPVDAGKM